ncbi:Hypothetical protein A7982_06161 [Minicystis rosea]|nr:Hypothetical protein A7982_06161 [Minicystis rosea]
MGARRSFGAAVTMIPIEFASALNPEADYFYGHQGPWPKPFPGLPDRLPGTVLDVPEDQATDYANHILRRYRRLVVGYVPVALLRTAIAPALEPMSDAELGAALGDGLLSRQLNATLDPPDLAAFADILAKLEPGAVTYKLDCSVIERLVAFDGVYFAPTVTLLRRLDASGTFMPLAIRIRDLVLTPEDGDAWVLAKWFVLQGAALQSMICHHPRTHFPMDAIAAVSQSLLPRHHGLFRVLSPHMRFQLPLNNRVLHSPFSVAHNDQRHLYSCFPGPFLTESGEGFGAAMTAGYEGIPGNSSYPPYRYSLEPAPVPSSYGRVLRAYYDVIRAYVAEILEDLSPEDPVIARWADSIARWVPGFPDALAIRDRDTWISAVAFFIYDVSVLHAADHHSTSCHPLTRYPLRLRVPPPTSKVAPPFRHADLVSREDMFRHRMARKMFFGPPVSFTLLQDTDSGFDDPRKAGIQRRFRKKLREAAVDLDKSGHIPLRLISCSIQF